MSRPLTLEQSLLNEADRLLTDFSLLYERRLQVLEACASRTGGFDIDEYWKEFKIDVTDGEAVKSAAETLSTVLAETDIPASLAISSLAREPISVSEKKQHGAFYTDFRLAQFVAEDCQHYLEQNSRIADIAAGSGILLAAVAAQYFDMFPENYNQWISRCVYAFDLSENALRGARIAVAALSSSVKAIKLGEIKLYLQRYQQIFQVPVDKKCYCSLTAFIESLVIQINMLWEEFSISKELVTEMLEVADEQNNELLSVVQLLFDCYDEIVSTIKDQNDPSELIQLIEKVFIVMFAAQPFVAGYSAQHDNT